MPLRAPRGYIAEDDPRVSQFGHPAPPWLVNYADLMTEMVAFFVILYALGAALNKDVQQAKQAIEEMMAEEQIEGTIEVDREGMRVTLQESEKDIEEGLPFFESGKADLTPHMIEVLTKLSPKLMDLAAKKHDVLVEGHTDAVPVGGRYQSNWELSTMRATVVVRYMIDNLKFPVANIGAVGYGEYRPVAPNDSEDNRRKNRRVVFFVKNPPPSFQPETEQ